MMKYEKLPERLENSQRYDVERRINNLIAEAFWESVDSEEWSAENIEPITDEIILIVNDFKDVPYGGKNLGEADCAVFCIEQGLYERLAEGIINITSIAKLLSDKGYCGHDEGTDYTLFDHLGLRRASHVQEIFDMLKMGNLVTILVQNDIYSTNTDQEGSHFVNIVGVQEVYFIIDDSLIGRIKMPINRVLKAIRVAWVW